MLLVVPLEPGSRAGKGTDDAPALDPPTPRRLPTIMHSGEGRHLEVVVLVVIVVVAVVVVVVVVIVVVVVVVVVVVIVG